MNADYGRHGDWRLVLGGYARDRGDTHDAGTVKRARRGRAHGAVMAMLALGTMLALGVPFASASSRGAARTTTASVPAGLLAAAQASPAQIVRVIVQGNADTTSADVARTVSAATNQKVTGRLGALDAVWASLTGSQLVRLAAAPGILAITGDDRIAGSGNLQNPQKWPGGPGVAWYWSSPAFRAAPAATIAIVDSGVDTSNGEFGNRLLTQVDLSSQDPSVRADGRGHGTFVAAVAAGAGTYAGAAPSENLVSLKVFNDLGQGYTSDVLRAADWILQNEDRYDIRVANFSLQTGNATSFRFDPVDRAVEALWHTGVVVVAAAGNYGSTAGPSGVLFSPANDPFVITVGALDVNGSPSPTDDVNAPWSSYGYTVDGFAKPELSAPGRYMIEWVPPDSSLAAERPFAVVSGGMQLSGTSFAAPVVSGIAADLLGLHPNWTPDQVKGELMRSATLLKGTTPLSVGVGEVNVKKALGETEPPPNPNAALDGFLEPDPGGGPYPVFDGASWASSASSDASWNSASWNSASWASASWNSASWASASWNSASWASASWNSDSWLSDVAVDNAAAESGGVG